MTGEPSRTFVLGLDGVPWERLRSWVAAGHLKNFQTLFADGAAGPLESTIPATTPAAWPSLTTGVRPDKHGLYAFRRFTAEYSHRMYTNADVASPRLWEYLDDAVVVNVPMTYPVSDIDGAMVSGMMTPTRDGGFASPSSLADDIDDQIPEYRIELDWTEYDRATPAFQTALAEMVEGRRALVDLLLDRTDWRLCFVVFTAPDRLQHLTWDAEPGLALYRQLDDVLGDVMARVTEHDATLYVMSDHGFGPVSTFVHVNRLLAEEGYLQYREQTGVRGVLSHLGVTKADVLDALGRLGIDEASLVDALPRRVVDGVATEIPGDHLLYDVDFAETTAFVYGPGTLYVNDTERFAEGTVPPGDVPDVVDDLVDLFEGLTDPETGAEVVDVHAGAELFPTDPTSPDLVVKGTDGYEVHTSDSESVFAEPEAMAASHRSEGILLAWGPTVEPGATPSDASVYDIVPTILHERGRPVPTHVDGRVLTEIFAPESGPASRSVEAEPYRTDSDAGTAIDRTTDFDEVEDRLRGLGYVE